MRADANKLTLLGFCFARGSIHTKRTMMLKELRQLLLCVPEDGAQVEYYYKIIVEQNCLSKKTFRNRKYSATYLRNLYGLDPSLLIFRALRFFRRRDQESLPLLALLCVYARDGLLRAGFPYIASLKHAERVEKDVYEAEIERQFPGRFNEVMLHSLVRNLLSTWTQSGHLAGYAGKIRSRPRPSAGSAAYAMLLGYCQGARGAGLFESEFAGILECPRNELIVLLEEAAGRGMLIFKRIGNVVEVNFPELLTRQDLEVLHEQC